MLTKTERLILRLLNLSLHKKTCSDKEYICVKMEWEPLCRLAESQSVTALLYEPLEKEALKDERQEYYAKLKQAARITAKSNYRLLFLTKYVTMILKEHGICGIVLKGCATAGYYPVPEYRKSGDVDILVTNGRDFKRAREILIQEGFHELKEQIANHHIEFKNEEGISVELHCSLVVEFEKKQVNRILQKLLASYEEHIIENVTCGFSFYQPQDAYHVYFLLLHMLKHYLQAGFGVKFLCDWVAFWEQDVAMEEKKIFWKLAKETGIDGFACMVTSACVAYLGLPEKKVSFMLRRHFEPDEVDYFVKDMLAAGEFGRDDRSRMVVLPGTGILAYVKEFHHQMHINYSKAGKMVFLWPMLWAATLCRFLYNNRKLRKVKVMTVFREARSRSRLVDSMQIFQKKKRR